ncbi:hypothetical protein QVD99_003219 [Batrachochytrium dendrobatidis]|nr:hypothetical protein O5D80_001618 [Batrachochytrium dendrobatidis]KAK5670540.1 hypothetical protein QVD99_003219 [Batrachochytrium dendrobatidis]
MTQELIPQDSNTSTNSIDSFINNSDHLYCSPTPSSHRMFLYGANPDIRILNPSLNSTNNHYKPKARTAQPSDTAKAFRIIDNLLLSLAPTNYSIENRLRASWNLAMVKATPRPTSIDRVVHSVSSMSLGIDSIVVIYASQTGTAEAIARHIHGEALLRGFQSYCFQANDVNRIPWLENNMLVFVSSTTGDGHHPDNSNLLWKWLRPGSTPNPATVLAGKPYTILGLGDSNYTNFCTPAKRLDRRLIQLGAKSVLAKALADASVGIESVVDPWIENLWLVLNSILTRDHLKAAAFAKLLVNQAGSSVDLNKDFASNDITTSNARTQSGRPRSFVRLARQSFAASTAQLAATSNQNDVHDSVKANLVNPNDCYSGRPMHLSHMDVLASSSKLTGLAKAPVQLVDLLASENTRDYLMPINQLLPCLDQPPSHNAPLMAKISNVRCLTGQIATDRVLEIELDLTGLNWNYAAGDAFGILAPNPSDLVQRLIERLNLGSGNQIVELSPKQKSDLPFTTATPPTYTEILTYFIELHALPKKSFFRLLAEYTTNVDEKKQLLFLCSTQGSESFKNLRAQQPNILDILSTFKSCSPPFSILIDCLGCLQPRFYSAASSPIERARIRFAFNVVSYGVNDPCTNTPKPMRGLCSSWLDSLTGYTTCRSWVDVSMNDVYIPIFPRVAASAFHLPKDIQHSPIPLILIASGTGISPFISFLESLAEAKRLHPTAYTPRPVWLIHGHRFDGDEGDSLYHSEIQSYISCGIVTEFVECVSRGEHPSIHSYVQDAVWENRKSIWELVDAHNACLYICGSLAMGKGIHDMLIKVIMDLKNVGSVEAVRVLNELSDGRYLREVWG